MKTLRVTMQFCLLLCLLPLVASVASASPLTLTGNLYFPNLDGSAQDSDGLANGIFTVADALVLDGTIHCNDAPPLPASASACAIWIKVAGDLTLEPGSGIFAENRRGSGNGNHIKLEVGGALTLRGSDGSLPGAIVSTSQTLGGGGTAGNLTAKVSGAVDLEAGSILAASSSGTAGAISVTGDTVRVAGLVASGHSRTVLPTFLTGEVLAGSSSSQAGGTILLKAEGAAENSLRIESEAIVVSEGRLQGGRLVLLQGCGIEVFGLVASVSRNHGPSQVVLRSGKGILVDGRDLGAPDAPERRFGRIRADSTQQGAAGYLVDLFAQSSIQVLGPDPAASSLFAVSSTPGDWTLRNAGGAVTALSLAGTLTATGRAFQTGRNGDGDKGGTVDLQAQGNVMLDGATLWSIGGFSYNSNAAAGGQIDVRSFQGAVSWTFGVGDVRPTGSGILLPSRRGTIEITACTTVDLTGTQFPVNGNPVSPFPVETEGVCSPAAPSLPAGEPALPQCAPANQNQPPAPTGGPFSVAENSPNGTVVGTVSANDPDAGQTHTFSIISGNTGNAFAIDPSTGQLTVANSAALDFDTTPSFTLTIQATDNGTPNLSDTGTVTVNLTEGNAAPAPSGGPFAVPENSPNGTVVGTVAANDPDPGQTHTFSIVSGNTGNAFAIDSSTGQLTVANTAALDFETTPSFTLTIQATDNGSPNLSGTGTVVVNLTGANEPPVPSGGPFAVPENSPNGTSVGTVSANDPDAGQAHTFSITNGNTGGAFVIDPATGQITVANSAALNFEAMPSFSLTVQVTDSGSLTASTLVTVNLLNVPEAPVAVDEGTPANPYVETVGNTLLEVTASPSASGAKIVFNGNFLTNDFDPDGPTTFTVTLESKTAGAVVTLLDPNGTFTYVPPPGFVGVDSFTYRITAPDGQFDTATVYINVEHRVWYVRNDAEADGLGRSTDPFDTLTEAESASQAGDTIYLFAGNGTTTGQSDGIVLKSGQRLIGEAVQLAAPATVNINGVDGPTLRSTTGAKPRIENDNAPDAPGEDNGVSVPATAGSVAGVEIRGLEISGFDNAIDVTATGTNNASVTIRDNVISGANFEGIDVTAASTGTVTLAIHDNTLTTTGAAIDVQRTAGTTYITAFDDNAVSGNTAGTGINISGAIFDAVPGSSFDTVSGGVTVIGAPGNGVGQSGLVLTNVQGRLTFADLDVFADGGAGLRASSSTAYTGSAGLQLVVSNPGVAILEATGGPVVDISQASISLPLSTIKSTNSSTTGLALNSVTGSFSAEPTSSISNIASPSGTAFQVGSSNATIAYKGTINTTQGKGVDLTGNTGSTISFSGTLTLTTGSNPAFAATGGGTLTSTDAASTLTTTTGTALNVSDTSIGTTGLTFRRISSNGAANGIRISNTGATGFLTVTGTGSDDSGGSIVSSTQDGVFLNGTRSITLNEMTVSSSAQSHIEAISVNGLTLNGIETDLSTDHGVLGNGITNLTISGGTFHRGGAGAEPACNKDGVNITNLLGVSSVTGATFTRSNTRQFYVTNTTTSGVPDTLTVSGTTWNTHTGPCSGDHLSVAADTGGNLKLVTNSSSGENNFSSGGIGIQAVANGSGSLQASITGVETSGNTAGVAISGTGNGNVSFRVYDNRSALGTGFTGTGSVGLILTCTTTGTCQGAFEGNSITHTAGTSTNAMQVVVEGNGTGRVTVANNTVSGNFQRGFHGQSRSGTGSLSLNVTGNNFTATDAGGLQVMNFEVGASGGGTTNSLCLNLAGNTAIPVGGMTAYRLLHRTGYTYQLQNLAQASTTNTADVQNWVSTTKANAGAPVAVTVGGTPYTTSAGCATPTLPTP